MDTHKLLKRQLEKSNIIVSKRPETDEQWFDFIARVNKAYIEADQERYMHERSVGISSREMMGLNKKLEDAQHIAKLGYWSYDGNNDHIIWSKELLTLFNLSPVSKPPTYKEFMKLVYEKDRDELKQKVERALKDRINYECEIRVRQLDGTYHWYRTIGQCRKGEKQLEGILIDIHKNKIAEEKIKELNQKLLTTARRAGMAEVATCMLHNIGNILNSSNISINLLKNSFNQNYLNKLFKTLEMLTQHERDLSGFLINNSKGQMIPKYLLALSKILLEEHQKNSNEIDNLTKNLKHINKIVATQKSVSGTSSINESVYVPEIIETALNMSINESMNESLKIIKEFGLCPLIYIDKSKLLHILVNLVQNAKDAVLLNPTISTKEIKITIKKINKNSIQIIVVDNGIGISSKNLNRIFSFGFTTKENGHGFGLHSSALSAQEMGGSLLAESIGEGLGAQFILTLPINSTSNVQGVLNE